MAIYLNTFPGGKHKALTFSYDDGHEADRRLVKLFNKYGLKATFNLNTSLQRKESISSGEINSLYKGHEIAVHSHSHPKLEAMPGEAIVEEIIENRRILENLLGYPVNGMAYPGGTYDDNLVKMLPNLGIDYSRTIESHGKFSIPNDFYRWHPTCHHNSNIIELGKNFVEYERNGKLGWGKMAMMYM